MKYISIDIETYSDVDLQKCGVYRYTQSAKFEILLFGYAVDGGAVQVTDLARGDKVPIEIVRALTDDSVTKWAFNSSFERVCLSVWLQRNYPQYFRSYSINEDTVRDYLDPAAWKCSMVWSAYMGLPLSLAGVGMVLGLEEQKLKEGKDLIRYFCVSCKPTKVNGGRTRNLPEHDMEKWNLFKFYNKRDVEVEMSIQDRLKKYPVPDFVWDEYHLDQEINDRGIALDMDVVENALAFDAKSKAELADKMQKLTDLDNPNSVVQMKQWLADNGLEMDSLGKKEVAQAVKTAPKELAEVLHLRQQLSKSSVKKYTAMQAAVCSDGRVRGMFSFYGASRTGRQSSKIVQLQNLPQNHIPDLAVARDTVKYGSYEDAEMLYGNVPDLLSQLIRTAFVPRPGFKFVVADFSAIECRVLAWLAGEQWVLDTFANNGDIYCATASRMFHCKVEKHGENSELRQKGKQATLSCGYGGGVGALISMGALESGMKEEELKPLVDAWRAANPNIVRLWRDLEKAAITAVSQGTVQETHGLLFSYAGGMLFITLPSGRRLAYAQPKIGCSKFGGKCITYMGLNTAKKWDRLETFSGKIAENVTQAIARDLLFYSMQTLSHCFMVATVHDEIIIEADKRMSVDAVCEQMSRVPSWAKGLILKADGYECDFYQKN